MSKPLIAALLLGLFITGWRFYPRLQAVIPDDFQKLSGSERIARARESSEAKIRGRFAQAGVAYPPREMFLRAFKREKVLELWARSDDAPLRLVASWPVLAASGEPGPKRREGDKQVPEGFYVISKFNPESRFHLSLGLNYPNASDLVRSDPQKPGHDIFIHGKAVSIGCLAIGDDAIEELFLAALDARDGGQQEFPVHVFPAKMAGPEWDGFKAEQIAKRPELETFWAELAPIYDLFERSRIVPETEVREGGRYGLKAGPAVVQE